MLGVETEASGPDNAGKNVRQGVRRGMERAADAGFAVAWDEAPSGATNTLKHSGKEPAWMGDTLLWGFTADHARYVEEGTAPHWIPVSAMPELKLWARRVLGDEGAAWAVRRGIAREGTKAQPFVEKGLEEQQLVLKDAGIADQVDNEFRR
jgi:hypothetical protein